MGMKVGRISNGYDAKCRCGEYLGFGEDVILAMFVCPRCGAMNLVAQKKGTKTLEDSEFLELIDWAGDEAKEVLLPKVEELRSRLARGKGRLN